MLSLVRSCVRQFSCTARRLDRAVVYSQNGDPSKVLRVVTYPSLPPPPINSVNIQFLLSPINPADVNVVEGVYPTKPSNTNPISVLTQTSDRQDVFVGGNEGVAKITALGGGVQGLSIGDWIVVIRDQSGTWASHRNVSALDVIRVPDSTVLSEAQAATISVNPPSAYNMLSHFVELEPGDWVMQNGANSAVGQAVIQIAAARSLKTINFIRDRPDLGQLKEKLQNLGATLVFTYDQLSDKSLKEHIRRSTVGKDIRLGLNCVGGSSTTAMAKLLGNNAHLISYGAMAKQPLSLPASLFIFKNLTCHGYWQSHWTAQRPPQEREKLMQILVNLIKDNKLHAPENEILTISQRISDDEATEMIRKLINQVINGRYGKKVLLKIE